MHYLSYCTDPFQCGMQIPNAEIKEGNNELYELQFLFVGIMNFGEITQSHDMYISNFTCSVSMLPLLTCSYVI